MEDNADYEPIRVLDQTADTMSVVLLDSKGPPKPLNVTTKGCVLVPKNNSSPEILFKSNRDGTRLAEVMSLNEAVQQRVISLKDTTAYKVTLGCSADAKSSAISPHIRDSVWVWAQVTSNYDERLPSSRHFEFEVVSQSKPFAPWNGDKQSISTSTLVDGRQELQITARLKAFPEIQFVQNCPFIKDSVAPAVNLKNNTLYYRNMSADIIQLLPAETMNMEISDANPVSLQACWRSLDDSSPCELIPTAKDALKAPSSGNWTLSIQARDQAGNVSNTVWPVVIYEKDKLSAVIQTAISARLLAESNRWLDALRLMTQVASDWTKTPNTEELSDIEAQIRASFVRLFLDQKPTLIQFDNKEDVEYLDGHVFLYTSSHKYPDMETLQLEIHDFSTRPSSVRTYKIKRSLNQGQPKILHASDESKLILVRINTSTWKLLDLEFKEVKTFVVPRAQEDDTLFFFPDENQAIFKTNGRYSMLGDNGTWTEAEFSKHPDTQFNPYLKNKHLFSLKSNNIWNAKGQVLFNASTNTQKIQLVSTLDDSAPELHFATYWCQGDDCDIQVLEFENSYTAKPSIKVPRKSLSDIKISSNGKYLVHAMDQSSIRVCEVESGECTQRSFSSKIVDICINSVRNDLVILTQDELHIGTSLSTAKVATANIAAFRNGAGKCTATDLGFGLRNTIQTTMIFADQEQTFQGDIQFTPDGVYAMEAGLNSSQVRIWSPFRYLYEKRPETHTSIMQPEQSSFSADGKILIKIADTMSIVDLSNGQTLNQLTEAIELTGLPKKAMASPKENELVFLFSNKVSKFEIKSGKETVLYSQPAPILDALDYDNRYLLRTTSGFISIDSNGATQLLSEYSLPFDHGSTVCSTFSPEANLYFLVDEKGSLLAIDVRNGSVKRTNLAFNAMFPEPIDVYSCILHWNSTDGALYVANQSSLLWRWKTDETSTIQILSNKSLELVALNSTPSGKIVLIGSDMTYDKILLFDPHTNLVTDIGLGIDIRGGWIDDTTKVSYIVGFDGEVMAVNPGMEDLNRIYWKVNTGINLRGVLVASGERVLVLETFEGEVLSLDLDIMDLLQKSCTWLRDANAGDTVETSCK